MCEEFTAEAKRVWLAILEENQNKLLNNLWCSKCSDGVTIKDYTGRIEGDNLILKGSCATCGHKVARVVESVKIKPMKNWIMTEAKKVKSNSDVVILENPKIKDYLDNILLKEFWPFIFSYLEDSGYTYSHEPHVESELSCELERSLTFMLFDGHSAFFRGKFRCSKESWMIESEFFLPLPLHNDYKVIFEILGNSRLKGNPPNLIIDKEKEEDYYQINFSNGTGASWGMHDENYIENQLKKVIDTNIDMYNFSEGGISLENIGEFLTMVYEVYEAF